MTAHVDTRHLGCDSNALRHVPTYYIHVLLTLGVVTRLARDVLVTRQTIATFHSGEVVSIQRSSTFVVVLVLVVVQ